MAYPKREHKQEMQEYSPLLMQEMTRVVPAAAVMAVPLDDEDVEDGGKQERQRLSSGGRSSDMLTAQEREVEAIRQGQARGRVYAEREIASLRTGNRNSHVADNEYEARIRRGNLQQQLTPMPDTLGSDPEPPSAPPHEEPTGPGYKVANYSSVYDSSGGYKVEEYRSIYD